MNKLNMWYLICIPLLATFLLIILLVFKNRRKIMMANRIPGPNMFSIINVIPAIIIQGPEKLITNLREIYQTNEKKKVVKFWFFNNLIITLTQPEDIKFALNNTKLLNKSQGYSVMQESIMGQGIFTCNDVKIWKNNRKIVVKSFTFTMIKSFLPIFYEEAAVLAEILQNNCNSESTDCDISVPVSKATMEMIGRTAMGVRFDTQKSDNIRFIENLQIVMHTWEYRILHPWFLSKTLFRFSSMSQKHDRSQKIINEFADEIINRKFIELQQSENSAQKILETDNNDRRLNKTFIELLLEHHSEMSHEQIREEIVTIMVGGQETTAFINACVIFILAHHQDIQIKVFEELQTIFSNGNPERPPSYDDLLKMEYLERVIKETLRHYPSAPGFGRKLEEDMQIGKYMIPAGSLLTIWPLYLHKSPLLYPGDPNKFDPDRFLPEACQDRHPYAFLPFSAGARNCVGIKYAMFQMKTILSTLVRKFQFSPSSRCPTPDHLRLMFLITLKFVDHCPVRIEPRAKGDRFSGSDERTEQTI